MTESASNKSRAVESAIALALDKLADVDLPARCEQLGLGRRADSSGFEAPFLDQRIRFYGPDWHARYADTNEPCHPADRLLVLHYLLRETAVTPTGRWITFRDFPGGSFYQGPFQQRSSVPLARSIGDRVDRLQHRLEAFHARAIAGAGDFAAAVGAIGAIDLAIVYHAGDEEFSPAAEVLFDACCREVYGAEDAAALASRLCLRLVGQACDVCGGCGLCDETTPSQMHT